MRWWAADPDRWDRELREMGGWFPEWEYIESIADREVPTQGGSVKQKVLVIAWEGRLQPLPQDSHEAVKILADLANDQEVLVTRGGMLRHHERCRASHSVPDAVRNRNDFGVVFHLLAHQFPPPTHPKVYALQPHLGPELFHSQGHVNGDGSLCPLFAPDGAWNGIIDTLAKYLRAGVAPLLAKHLYWQWTLDATGRGVWPGTRGPHGPAEAMLTSLARSPDDQCWCGSGKPHKECHREHDRKHLSVALWTYGNLKTR